MSGSKTSTQPSSRSQNPISSNPLGLPTTPAVKPKETITLGNGSQSDIGYRKAGLAGAFEENIGGGYASPLQQEQSQKLKQIQSVYGGDQKAITKAQSQPIGEQGQINQGFSDDEKTGNRAAYVYNELLNGAGSLAAGLGDVGALIVGSYRLSPVFNPANATEFLKSYREEVAPQVREYLREAIGADLDKSLENKYRSETLTSAIGGLAQSLPSIAAAVGSGGVGAASMFLQSYDGALQSLDQSEAGQSLDPLTKTIYATGIGTVSTLLEKAGLDRIMKGNSTILSKLLTDKAIAKATAETGGKVTGDALTKFLNKEVVDLNNKFLKGGAKVLDSYLTEYATGASQEAANVIGEGLINATTGKPVFDTSDIRTWDGFVDISTRINKAGNLEGLGGGLLGTVAALGGFKKADFDKKQQSLNDINAAINDENVSDVSKEVLVQQKIKLQNEIEEDAKVIDKAFNKLGKAEKDAVIDIVEQKAKIEEVKADPNVPDEIKKGLDEQVKELDKQLSEIKPVDEVKVEKPTEYFNKYEDAVKEAKTVEEAYNKATSLSENGKLSDTFNRKYNPDGKLTPEQTFEKFYDEVKQPVEAKEKANTPEFNLKDVKKPSGSIGNQGATETGAKSILDHLGINVTFKGEPTMREMVEHLKNNSKDRQKLLDFVKNEPIVLRELPDGTYQLEDGHHRATLLYYSGVENVPANIVNKGEYIDKNKTTINTETTQETVTEEVVAPIQEATINKPKEEQLTPKPKFTIKGETITPKIDAETKSELPIKEVPVKEETKPIKNYGYEDIDAMTDEAEVAKALNQEIIDPSELTPVQQAIRQFGGVTTTEESYAEFGDINHLSKEAKKNFIRGKGQKLDSLAQEISKEGLEVTPADLVEYIDTFADGDNKMSSRAVALQEKLFDMSGKKFNKFTIKNYVDKLNERAMKKLELEPDALTDEQIELVNKEGLNADNFDAFADKMDWLYDRETLDNIKEYLDAKREQETAESNASDKQAKRSGKESNGLEKQSKAGDPIRDFAKKIREGKINKLGGFKTSTGFDAAWDLGIETVALSLEGGAKIADAIQSGLEAIKKTDWYKSLEDKKNFDEQYVAHMTNEYEADVEVKEKPKAKKQSEFDELANKRLPTRETRETASNVERETGDELKTSIKEFEGVDFRQSMLHGESVVEAAKVEFGDSYVTDLLEYVEESKMPFENKAVILVSLENNLRKQLLENPKDKRLRKQINVVTKASIEHLRSGATAAAVGIFRQAARVNYETQLAAEAIFSPKEMEARSKVEQAVYSTPEDVQKQYEIREAEIDQAIAEGVEKRINEIYESLPTARRQKADKAIAALDKIQKRLRSKTYDASIGVPVAIIDAGISTIKAAIKAGVNIADAVEAGIKKIREDYGKKWEKEDDFRKDMIDGFSAEGINASTDVTTNLKKELIDAGYGKEITVTTKDGKEKRKVYDWKKLLGVEGSFENLADALEKSMKGKGYSQAEIDAFQAQLQDEYNDIHADIIEKSVNELNRRNTPKDGSAKSLARRLAENYNLGAYEQDPDSYSNIFNNLLGVTPQSQEAFNEIRDFNRSLARLLETKDAKGNLYSDLGLASASTEIKDKIKRVIDKAQYADGSGLYKFSVIVKNLFSAMQRMLLVSPGQLIENPFSGIQNDVHVQLQDAFKKGSWDTKELAKYRKMMAKAMYKDIALAQGGEYGGVGNPFTSKNSIDEFVKGLSKNGLYQAFITASSGKAYLDAADSYFKVKRTENEFTHNLIRILTDKTNPNGAMSQEEALKYVSEIITGQSFSDAKKVAENIINDINKEAGKEVLRATDTNILRIANDIVKDSLVNGGGFTYDQVEASFKAAYRTAGKSMGHEANNFVSMGVQAINQKLQTNINNALKKKDYDAAAMWTMALTMSRNIISPFVGGGSNWVVIGLQKMGIPTEYFNPSVGWRKKPIDLSSKQGMKELEDALAANATRSRMYGRMLVGTTTALVAAMAMRAGMDEDEYRKWRRKHPETRKLIDKIQPVPITMILAKKDGTEELIRAMADAVGSRQNFDALKTTRATKDFIKAAESGNEKAAKRAWGTVGEMVGRKFTVPYLSNISTYGRSQDKIIKEFMGKKPERKKPSQGFVEGYFRGGLLDYLFGGEEEKPEK